LNEVAKRIANEIAVRGAISFARFMDLALYCPILGYYEKKKDSTGRRGDFFTSVSVGSLFGELLAYQFAEWIEQSLVQVPKTRIQPEDSVHIVEAGAHDGRLAKDILTWLRHWRPALFDQLTYLIVEPSSRRQQWQREVLEEFSAKIIWIGDLQELRGHPKRTLDSTSEAIRGLKGNEFRVRGIIFSNELLDSIPVQRWAWDARNQVWFEWGVAISQGQFVWTPMMAQSSPDGFPRELLPYLPDGFVREFCPQAQQWWRSAARLLACGKLLTIDYGLGREELVQPERSEGTLRAYRGHTVSTDVLVSPGEQDLTAHVDFAAIEKAGESAGLRTEQFTSQELFLMQIIERAEQEGAALGDWSSERKRQFQTLTSPELLGRFRVLVQRPNENGIQERSGAGGNKSF
jgi:SAM-dependent MidA family methyltransferase